MINVCAQCDDKGKKFQEWMKSPEFLQVLRKVKNRE